MKKKWLPALMVLSLIALIIAAGCANDTGGVEEDNDLSEANGGDDVQTEEDKPQLNVMGSHAPFDPNEDIMATDIIEETGYPVHFSMLPQDNADERLNIEIASGNPYDIVMLNDNQYSELVSQGALQPLDDWLEEHGQHLLDSISDETWELVTYDDEVFAIPQTNERANIEHGIMVREDVLADLNLEHPTNLDELKEVLIEIRDNTDMIPLTGEGNDIPTIYSAFGLYSYWNEVDGELVPRIKMPQMEEYMNFMVELQQEGLIDPDWAVNSPSTIAEKFAGNQAAMVVSGWYQAEQIVPGLNEAVENAETGWIQPLANENGEAGIQANLRFLKASAIPRSAEQPEEAMKYMNNKMDPDNFTYLTMGNEDEHFTRDGDVYEPIQPEFTEKRGNAYWYLNGMDEEKYPDMWLARLKRDEHLFEAYEELNQDYDEYAKINPVAFMPPSESVSRNMQVLTDLEEDFFIELLVGNSTIDDLPEFIERWEQEGGIEMTEAVNEWYQDQ